MLTGRVGNLPVTNVEFPGLSQHANQILSHFWLVNIPVPEESEKYIKVRLLFVRGIVEQDKSQVGKHDGAAFLTTDLSLAPQRILELYAMRWAIEVYFKEAKQHLGFLQEQSNHYAAYVASIHLTAMRFCMLVIDKSMQQASGISEVRNQIIANATAIDHATQLWHVFHDSQNH